jgi:hypothetical protein
MEELAASRRVALKTLTPGGWDELWNEVKKREKVTPGGVQ